MIGKAQRKEMTMGIRSKFVKFVNLGRVKGWMVMAGGLFFLSLQTQRSTVFALMPQDPLGTPKANTVVSPTLTLSSIPYEPKRGSDFEIDRKILGVGVTLPLGAEVDADLGFGLILDSEVENINEDGDGYQLLFGVKSMVHRAGSMGIHVNGAFLLSSEKIEDGNVTYEYDIKELHLGTTLAMISSPKVLPYVGLDLAIMSDGESKVKTPLGTGKGDFERDDMVDLRLGLKLPLGKVGFKAEALLLGETTINLGLDMTL
jgi:hypothetical protein